MKENEVLTFDLETSDLSLDSEFRIAAFSDGFITKSIDETVDKMIDILESGDCLSGHNCISFDFKWLLHNCSVEQGNSFLAALRRNSRLLIDTLHISIREFPTVLKGHGVGDWAYKLRGEGYDVPNKVEVDDWNNMPLVTRRVKNDVKIQTNLTDYLWEVRAHKLSKTYKFLQSYYPLALESMVYGLPLSLEKAKPIQDKLKAKIFFLNLKLKQEMKVKNPNSSAQINEAFKRIYGQELPKTEKGGPKFSKKIQPMLCSKFPLANGIFRMKELKAQYSFVDPEGKKKSMTNKTQPSRVHEGRVVRAEMNVVGGRTLRSQYSNPPLNQFKKDLRQIVKAPDGWLIVGIDIKGLENAILAETLDEVLGDDTLKKYQDRCPKQLTLDIFGNLFDSLPLYGGETLKDKAKTFNYANLFGQGVKASTLFLNRPPSDIPDIEEALAKRFPSLKRLQQVFINSTYEESGQTMFKTMYGDVVTTPKHCIVNTWCQTSGMVYAHMIFGLFYWHLHRAVDRNFKHLQYHCIVVNHDEAQIMFKARLKDSLKILIELAEEKTYESFEQVTGHKLIAKLDYQIGKTWKETH